MKKSSKKRSKKQNPTKEIRKQLKNLEGQLVKVYDGLTTLPYIGRLKFNSISLPKSDNVPYIKNYL